MHEVKGEKIITKEQLAMKVAELGARITEDYKGKELVIIGVLKGGFVFLADLVREITIPIDIDFISVSSYGNSTESSGVVKILKDIDVEIKGKHVVIVEDLVDTGLTLKNLKELLLTRNPIDIKVCSILDKPDRRKNEVVAEYNGLTIPDAFVVGYGLDYMDRYRNLPDVYILDPEVYS